MGLKSKKILGISVTTDPKEVILEYIKKYLENPAGKPLVVATPNPEQIVLASADSRFAKLLNQADVAIPDGIGVAFAAGVPRLPGVEFMEELVAIAAKQGFPVALIGGKAGVAVRAFECLQGAYPSLIGWAMEPQLQGGNRTWEREVETALERIVQTKTRLVFVGLGAPKQEEFIARLARQWPMANGTWQMVMMSVGGAFDMISGKIPRAPRLLRYAGLEWLWRLVRQPWRLRRQLALLKFLWLLASQGSALRS